MATAPQEQKFKKFQQHPLCNESLTLVKRAITVAELSMNEIGKTWGVTVCPDANTPIRLNVGNVAQMSTWKGKFPKLDPTGQQFLVSIAVSERELGILGWPRHLYPSGGFKKWVDDSITLSGFFEKWHSELFDNKKLARAFQAHAQQALKGMPNSNWHNPLVNDLLKASA